MAVRFIQLLCMSYHVCVILHVCSLQGVYCDVPDGVVYTDLHKTAEKGDELVMKCQFYGTPIAVYWKKGDDPTNSPNLITWVEGESKSGSCVHDGSCKMNANFSLIIRKITVSDQGSYICRVSNYKGILIHNFTVVSVFAPPMEPFPLIDECPGKLPNDAGQTCSIPTSNSLTITCSASSYFPDIDLFFLHGSKKMDTTNIEEVANIDGTRNKSISSVTEPSDSPYVCVASDIPGSQDQRTVTVIVTFLGSTVAMTISSNQTTLAPSQSGDVAKVVVPVILILAAICVAFVVWLCRKQRRYQEKDDPESMPLHLDPQIKGKVSFFELWYLVHNMDETNLNILRGALIDLGIPVVEDELTADEAYKLICDWKDTNTFDNEAMRLKNVLIGHGLGISWKEMCERRYDVKSEVSEELLDHVLWSIGDERKISQFLYELTTKKRKTRSKVLGNKRYVIEESMVVSREWRERAQTESQVIQLSLALERAKCKPLDRTFFKVPEHLMKVISTQEVEGFIYRLTERHCKRLAKAVGITDQNRTATIMDENNEDLVLIQSMVNEWVDGQECCNFEKRCTLDDAIIKIGRHDITDSFGTTTYRVEAGGILERPHPNAKTFNSSSIFDDDLESLLRHLPAGAIPLFLEKLGISVNVEGDDLEQKLQCWRDHNIKESNRCTLQALVSIHSDALKETNDSHALDLNDDELENVIISMTSAKQVDKLMSSLVIQNDMEQPPLLKLKEWRNKCKMEKRRETLREALYAMELSGCIVDRLPTKYVYQAELVRLAWNLFSIDVWPLTTLLGMDMSREKSFGERQMKGTVQLLIQLFEKSKGLDEHRRRDFCVDIRNLGYLDVARSGYFGYDASLSELCNLTSGLSEDEIVKFVDHLELEKDVLSVCQGPTGAYDNLKLMKILRNQLRLQPIHFRFELALGLRAVGKTEIACGILAGGHHTTEVGSRVVESICRSLKDDQLKRLCDHLNLKAQNDQSPTTVTATLVTEWVRNWLGEFEQLTVMKLFMDKINLRRKEIDNLFRAGFFQLAEEVMLLEMSRILYGKSADKTCEETPSKDDSDVDLDNEENQVASMEQASESMPSSDKCLETAGKHVSESKPSNEKCLEHASAQESDIKPANAKRLENAGKQESESKTANEKCLDNASDQGYVIITDIEEYDGSIMQV